MAKEKPVLAGRARDLPLLQKGAEGRDARAGSDHDDGRQRIGRQGEVMRLLHVELHRRAGRDTIGEKG